MGKSNISILLPTATTKKVTIYHVLSEERAKRAIRTARLKVAKAVQDAARVLRIMIFLHSAKDFPSALRLYGIEEPSWTE
jgi:hypothetical protein